MSEQLDPLRKEMLDVLYPSGELTGQVLDKKDIHNQELWHRDVHVWVTDGVNLLEQQRALDKTIMPGDWDISVGGHVAAGETYLDAAIRETEEEIGLAFPPDRFIQAGTLAVEMAMGEGEEEWLHRTVGDNFVVLERGLSLDDIAVQESEVAAARLYPIDLLEADLANPETASQHAPQPYALWALGIAAMRAASEGEASGFM
jgi:isopentenyldiphosphate isomerase